MGRAATIGVVTILVAACSRGSVPRDAAPVIDQFLLAAAAGDSLTIRQLTIGGDPASKMAAMRQREPALLQAAMSERRLHSSVLKGDTAYIAYRLPLGGRTEILTVGLVRRGDSWLVYNVGVPTRD